MCALAIIGVNERGQKQFLAIEDDIRESTQSWREILLKLKQRGMNPPKLAIGDGALAARLEAHQAAMVDTAEGKIAAVEARSAELQDGL